MTEGSIIQFCRPINFTVTTRSAYQACHSNATLRKLSPVTSSLPLCLSLVPGAVPKKIASAPEKQALPVHEQLFLAIIEGNREEVTSLTEKVLAGGLSPTETANDVILKALEEVGKRFQNKIYFLPQVIRSAEAAQNSFAYLKPLLKKSGTSTGKTIALATVKGDVHDIGKNILGAVLESHGWEVIDLGKNIDADTILNEAQAKKVKIIGLSALMTTTMLEMEKIIQKRNEQGIPIKIIIGGAPVTERFANEIGADAYARDAVEAPAICNKLIQK